jgi:hypothetical protein
MSKGDGVSAGILQVLHAFTHCCDRVRLLLACCFNLLVSNIFLTGAQPRAHGYFMARRTTRSKHRQTRERVSGKKRLVRTDGQGSMIARI